MREAIDIIQLVTNFDTKKWNALLAQAERSGDLTWVLNTRRALQVGMADAARKKMNTEKLNLLFIRLQKSLENTGKNIFRSRNKNPMYDPLNAHKYGAGWTEKKRALDQEFERILKKSGY